MKAAIIIFILFTSNSIFACDNSPSDGCNTVQLEYNELSHTEADECCNEMCFCNCCNQVSVISVILNQNILINYSTHINFHSLQNLSYYTSSPWQPPNI